MERKDIALVITGHIDHGKSTLIGRLLFDTNSLPRDKMEEALKASRELGKEFEFAFLVDQLQEEREKELTIDTTQAFFKTNKRHYIIIDAPGHAEFIKNMITGATQAEAAVVVVSAEKGVEEQTKRHAYILGLLGISTVIGVINKMDLVEYSRDRFESVRQELQKFFDRIGIKNPRVLPLSAKTGAGVLRRDKLMNWYKGPTLIEALDAIEPRAAVTRGPLRFPIQDIYPIEGKEVAVGRVVSGTIRRNQDVVILPSRKEARIDSIHVFGECKTQAREGENIGIQFTGQIKTQRGDVVCQKDDIPPLSKRFKGNIFWMSSEPLRVRDTFLLRCATQEAECSVVTIEKRLNSSTLEATEDNPQAVGLNEVGAVVLEAKTPLVIEKFTVREDLGRFGLEVGGSLVGSGTITGT